MNRWSTEYFQGSDTILSDVIMVETRHDTFVDIHRLICYWRKVKKQLQNEETESKQTQRSSVDVTDYRRKVQCCKGQHCARMWNVRSMNQGKLEAVKQEMPRVNIDILGISELKWTGMGNFNLDEHYISYCGQESFRRNGVAIIVNKRVRNAVLGRNLKNDRIFCYFPRQTTQYHSNLSLCSSQ